MVQRPCHSRGRESSKYGAELGHGDWGSFGGQRRPNILRSTLVPRKRNTSQAVGIVHQPRGLLVGVHTHSVNQHAHPKIIRMVGQSRAFCSILTTLAVVQKTVVCKKNYLKYG